MRNPAGRLNWGDDKMTARIHPSICTITSEGNDSWRRVCALVDEIEERVAKAKEEAAEAEARQRQKIDG